MVLARGEALRATLDRLTAGAPRPATASAGPADAWQHGLDAFEASFALDHGVARAHAERAIRVVHDDDVEARVLAYAALALASCGLGIRGSWASVAPDRTPSGDPLADALELVGTLPATDTARFARYALAEAALASARLTCAAQLPEGDGSGFLPDEAGRPHPFGVVITVLAARIAAFQGRVAEASALLAAAPRPDSDLLAYLVDGTRGLIEGNAGQAGSVRSIATRIENRLSERSTRVDLGCALLAAYGLIAIGDVARSSELAAGPHWERAMVVDRALVLELLVSAAARAGDEDALEAWHAVAEELSGDPICDSTLDRIRSRVALATGDAALAVRLADRSVERARVEGRMVEAAEAEIIAARARIAAGDRGGATRRLEALVSESEVHGWSALRRAAGRELLRTGRRLRPVAGSGSQGLSAREREVLALLLDGHRNAEIAAHLHISLHTARVHVSRVLAAFGAATRVDLARRVLADLATADPTTAVAAKQALAQLTPRQREVVAILATGASNAEVARRLDISERTVEKHLADVMTRWGVETRVGVLLRASGVDAPTMVPDTVADHDESPEGSDARATSNE